MLGVLERPRVPQAQGPLTIVLLAIERLSETLCEETRALRQSGGADLERFTHQKNYGLLELTRAMRALPAHEHSSALSTQLRSLRARLDENLKVLGLHLAAAEEIADLVSGTLEDAASDGTYTACVARGGGR